MERKVLNIGCNLAYVDNATNHDRTKHSERVDIAWDLNVLPWPWEDESWDLIIAKAVLEHLNHDLIVSVNECWRILRPHGQLYTKLPYWHSEISHDDPSHRWYCTLNTMDWFDPKTRNGRVYSNYTPYKWRIRNKSLLNKSRSSIHTTMAKLGHKGMMKDA